MGFQVALLVISLSETRPKGVFYCGWGYIEGVKSINKVSS